MIQSRLRLGIRRVVKCRQHPRSRIIGAPKRGRGNAAVLLDFAEKIYAINYDVQFHFKVFWLNNNFLLLQIPLAALLFWIGSATGAGGWGLVLWGIPLRLVIV